MTYECRAERLSAVAYDDVTLIVPPRQRQVIIENSPCRIWEITGAQALNIGGTDLMVENLQLSLPYDTPILKRNDEVEITNTPDQDTSIAGKRFRVLSSARAGELRATRRYAVEAIER
jgi:hypothetical protein